LNGADDVVLQVAASSILYIVHHVTTRCVSYSQSAVLGTVMFTHATRSGITTFLQSFTTFTTRVYFRDIAH
jgi:hypothetical protein